MPEVLTETEASERDKVDAAAIASYYRNVKGSERIALEADIVEALRAARAEATQPTERERLRDQVVEAAVEEYKFEHAADYGSNTITRTEALIKMQQAMKKKREAVKALLDFESQNKE